MADFVLINPPFLTGARTAWRERQPPLGLLAVAAFLRRQGIDATVIDADALGFDCTRTAQAAAEHAPLVCGLTAVTATMATAAEIASKLKRLAPDTITVVGGAHVSARPEQTLDAYRSIDYAALGEGEVTAWELFDEVEKGGDPRAARGVAFRDGGEIRRSRPRPPIANLDELPLPAWELLPPLPLHYGPAASSVYRLPSLALTTARGDPYHLVRTRAHSVFGRKHRRHGAARVFEMMEHLYRHHSIVDFAILDESLLMDEGRLVELCRLILRSALPLSFSCAARPDQTISAFALRELAAAGCWQMTFDLGAGVDETLRALGLGVTVAQTIEALRTIRRAGIATKATLRLGAPGETTQALAATKAFALRAPLDDIAVGFFAAYPGAEISHDLEELGAWFGGDVDKREGWVSFVPIGSTPGGLRAARRRLLRRFYLRPRVLLQYLRRLREPSCRRTLYVAATAFVRQFVLRG